MAKNKNETEWVEPLSPECQQWWVAARPKAWWVIQIPYALWHMLLEGFLEEGEGMGWEARERERWRGARVCVGGWRGVCFDISVGKWWKGLLTSPSAHTLQKDTTPSSWRQRERAQEGNKGETESKTTGDKTQAKTGVRYCRDTCIRRLRFHRWTHQQERTSTVFYIQHTNLIHKDKHVKHKQNKSSENDDTSDVSERRWRSKCDRTTCQILPLGS